MSWLNNQKISTKIFVGDISVGLISGIFGFVAAGQNAVTMAILIAVAVLVMVGIEAITARVTTRQIRTLLEATEQLAQGNLNINLQARSNDEIGLLTASLARVVETINALARDTEALTHSAVEGKLDARVDASKHSGEYRVIVEGVNATLDAVIEPLNVAAEYIERIGQGDIPAKITNDYKGDFNEIKNNLNHCIDGMGGLVESSKVLDRMALHDYTNKVEGQYQGIFAEAAKNVNEVRDSLLFTVETNTRIAAGDFAGELEGYKKVGKLSEQDNLIPSFIMSMENIQRLVDDTEILAGAAVEGRLDVRADVTQHQGEFRKVVEGVNATLDAVIGPLNTAAEYIERIAKGDIPAKITRDSKGDFNEIKNSLNYCIEQITTLVEEVGVVITAGVEGKLEQRANTDRVQGVYHEILAGVNATLDSVVEPVMECKRVMDELAKGRLHVSVTGDYQGAYAEMKDALNITTSSLQRLIGEVSEVLQQIADGNLDVVIEKDYEGDFVDISSAIKNIISSFNEIMVDIDQASEQVAAGSGQISDSSQALAQGASEQASAIEQLTAAITQIAAQTKQNASNANQANELALNAKDNAVQGNAQMQEMLEAMEGINASSANISKIIKVIDEIAFQTNILALNAAVEAAHAGQQGKGFAVVAEEVRNLAARSASAAKETTDLIEGSIHKVQSGTKIANDTAEALKRIVDGVSQAAALVGDIAEASNEQATGIAQIDQGIVQVSQVVQTNSATAQQSAAASEELSSQAELLKNNVEKLVLKERQTNFQGDASKAASQKPKKQEAKIINLGKPQAAAASTARARIALDDGDFGKY